MVSLQWFVCLVLLSVFRSSISSEEGGDLKECEHQRGLLLDDLGGTFRRCVRMTSPRFPKFSANPQLSECLVYTQAFCTSLPSIRECLDEESNKWARCHNTTYNKVFGLFRETLKSTLSDLCQDGGETLSSFLYSFITYILDFRARNKFVRECIIDTSVRLQTAGRSKADVPSKYWYIHQEIEKFRDCLSENIKGDEDIVRSAVKHINITLDTMKCLHPGNESVLLCKDLGSEAIDRAGLCPFKTKSELMVPLSFLIENRMTICFVHSEPYGPVLSDAQTIEDFQEYFRRYCRRQDSVKNCILDTSQAAQICLNENDYQIFMLMRSYLELVLEGGCFEEGKRLATMFHTAHVIKEETSQQDSLTNCLKQAQEKRNKTMDDPARIYAYYQELPVVRECLLQKVGDIDGDAFLNDVTEFIQILEEGMKCFNPQDKSVVLCKTIQNNNMA